MSISRALIPEDVVKPGAGLSQTSIEGEVDTMNILYILKQEPDGTLTKIMDEHKKDQEVTVVDLRENKDYDQIVDLIASTDKVISW